MTEVISYKHIKETVQEEQKRFSGRIVCFDSVSPATEKLMTEINSKIKRHSLVAILFCNPETPFAKNEILPALNYFHKRSKQYINIFCCGFGANGSSKEFVDMKNVVNIDGEEWFYSDEAFVNVVEEFEERTKWQYSGENELLILDVIKNNEVDDLSIGCSIVCNLEKMKNDNAFTSVRSLMEKLINYAKSNEAADAWEFSDKQGLSVAGSSLKNAVLSLLPAEVKNLYTKAESYAVKQI